MFVEKSTKFVTIGLIIAISNVLVFVTILRLPLDYTWA